MRVKLLDAEELSVPADLSAYPDLAQLHAYWRERSGDAFAPARASIQPTDFPEILPRIMLCDVGEEGDAHRFRYRLSGTGICDVHGVDLTGLSPEEFTPPEYGRMIARHYGEAVALRRPLAHVIILDMEEAVRSYARIILPLSADGDRVNMLLMADSEKQNSVAEFAMKLKALRRRRWDETAAE